MPQIEFFAAASHALALPEPAAKCRAVAALAEAMDAGACRLDRDVPIPEVALAGRPQRPRLVPPREVPRRRLGQHAGRVALVHAIAHIEFNAINLALDAACRFRDMPDAFRDDWISVAADEARHFALLAGRLRELGQAYGDLPAHDGLWRMCVATADSCLARMALVPRVLEARGLDVTPGMIERLRDVGDEDTVACLEVILAEEVRHVAIGTRWFHHCCAAAGLDPDVTFARLLERHAGAAIKRPFNRPARREAGFSGAEFELLERLAS